MNKIMSEKIDCVSKALMIAKKQIRPVLKDSVNPHFKSKYASLGAFIDATDEALSDHGLLLFQCTEQEEGKPVLITTITHVESGQWIRSSAPLLNLKGDSQGLGSAITYMRRYCISAMLGISADDDDGHKACEKAKQENPKSFAMESDVQKQNIMTDFIRQKQFDDSLHYSIRGFLTAHCNKFNISMSEAVIKYQDKEKLLKDANTWVEAQKRKLAA